MLSVSCDLQETFIVRDRLGWYHGAPSTMVLLSISSCGTILHSWTTRRSPPEEAGVDCNLLENLTMQRPVMVPIVTNVATSGLQEADVLDFLLRGICEDIGAMHLPVLSTGVVLVRNLSCRWPQSVRTTTSVS